MSLKNQILEKLDALGASPKRSLGQNFLIDEEVVKKIIRAVKLREAKQLIEIGPGLGSLTELLLELGPPLKLVELDRRFAQVWREKGIEVVEEDALQLDWQTLALPAETVLVSNLPFQISSSLVVERCLGPTTISAMILMFQKEVGQRLMASPRSKDYGMLTVMAQLFWKISIVCEAGPRCFLPPPNVASRVLMFQRREDGPNQEAQGILSFVKVAFSHRRKIIWKNLAGEYSRFGIDSSKAISCGQALGIGPLARAEELSPEQFRDLFRVLSESGASQ